MLGVKIFGQPMYFRYTLCGAVFVCVGIASSGTRLMTGVPSLDLCTPPGCSRCRGECRGSLGQREVQVATLLSSPSMNKDKGLFNSNRFYFIHCFTRLLYLMLC